MLEEGGVAGDRNARTEQFVRELSANTRRIYAHVLSLLPNWADADEVFQKTCILLWQKFDEYEPGTNFRAWAFRVAYYKVLQLRQQRQKNVLAFSSSSSRPSTRTRWPGPRRSTPDSRLWPTVLPNFALATAT